LRFITRQKAAEHKNSSRCVLKRTLVAEADDVVDVGVLALELVDAAPHGLGRLFKRDLADVGRGERRLGGDPADDADL
jgi:hypothetical protein